MRRSARLDGKMRSGERIIRKFFSFFFFFRPSTGSQTKCYLSVQSICRACGCDSCIWILIFACDMLCACASDWGCAILLNRRNFISVRSKKNGIVIHLRRCRSVSEIFFFLLGTLCFVVHVASFVLFVCRFWFLCIQNIAATAIRLKCCFTNK